MTLPPILLSYLDPWLTFLAADPVLRSLQMTMIVLGTIAVFLVFYTTRDILLRTNSFPYMLLCILIVAVLPGVGFLLYLLIRPPRTVRERELERLLRSMLVDVPARKSQGKKPTKADA
ncbi:MAG: PLDc N-terminal domain-containing protein [Candidatus Peribacteraceae bacterium]|nr:PLDc N-terminal domain-containing protein [Candidatus Peribacteraceae bacterium]